MSIKRGYETVPTNYEDSEQQTISPLPSSSSIVNIPSSGSQLPRAGYYPSPLQRITRYINYHAHSLSALLFGSIILFLALIFVLVAFIPDPRKQFYGYIEPPVSLGISSYSFQQGLSKCGNLKRSPPFVQSADKDRWINPRAPKDAQPVLLKNAIVWDGQGEILNYVDILMINGVIRQVEHDIQEHPANTKIIDVGGHIVSPGLVDMHTHLGVMSWPGLSGTSDTNEGSDPITPYVRTIDAFNPSDKAIRIVASGGITTALVLPGSNNLIGGEAYAFKLRPVNTLSNQDMLVQAGIDEEKEHRWRYMKMACGENPKGYYGRKGRMPSTRLGEAYLYRQSFADAQALIQAQEDWCSAAQDLQYTNPSSQQLDKSFPEDLQLESLTALLRGQVKLNIHCYETHDIEAMIRHANEFNFNISSFHHALEAYKIPAILKRAQNNITIATFADHWGYKKEAFGASPDGPKRLYEAGIPVALKSDHPVLNSQHMAFEAAKATHYGLPPQEAFKAITSVPAHALGLGHRVGTLRVGYDADVVIWDRSPLELGAAPLQVFIDGVPLFDQRRPIEPAIAKNQQNNKTKKDDVDIQRIIKDDQAIFAPKEGSKNYIIRNIASNLLKFDGQQSSLPPTTTTTMLIKDGRITCVVDNGDDCMMNVMHDEKTNNYETIDIQGGYILPGLVLVGSKLGMVEIPTEGSTGDGIVPPSIFSHDPKSIIEAVDGLKLGGQKLAEAYKGGVLTTISSPISRNVVMGISAAFKTNAQTLLEEGALLSPVSALHFQIGDSVKSGPFPTVSSQISFLRQIFTDNIGLENRYGQAARGEIPIIIMVNNKDEIASLIQLKRKIIPKARLAIMGGAEAHVLAAELAHANIAVILRPHLCTPENFDSIHCLTGAPLTNGTAAHILHYHGVKIGLAVTNDGWARNLAWDAGWLAASSPSKELEITGLEAIKFITTNLQEIFGLRGGENEVLHNNKNKEQEDEFVVWSGSPLDMQSRPLFVHTRNNGIHYL